MNFIGIDPGNSGCIAHITTRKGPIRPRLSYSKKLGTMTEQDLIRYLLALGEDREGAYAVIEKVAAMPHMGVRSAFTFGRNYGVLVASLTAAEIPFVEATSQAWQKSMGCLVRGRKDATVEYKEKKNANKRKAQQLFPTENITLTNCDAILIAKFTQQKYLELF